MFRVAALMTPEAKRKREEARKLLSPQPAIPPMAITPMDPDTAFLAPVMEAVPATTPPVREAVPATTPPVMEAVPATTPPVMEAVPATTPPVMEALPIAPKKRTFVDTVGRVGDILALMGDRQPLYRAMLDLERKRKLEDQALIDQKFGRQAMAELAADPANKEKLNKAANFDSEMAVKVQKTALETLAGKVVKLGGTGVRYNPETGEIENVARDSTKPYSTAEVFDWLDVHGSPKEATDYMRALATALSDGETGREKARNLTARYEAQIRERIANQGNSTKLEVAKVNAKSRAEVATVNADSREDTARMKLDAPSPAENRAQAKRIEYMSQMPTKIAEFRSIRNEMARVTNGLKNAGLYETISQAPGQSFEAKVLHLMNRANLLTGGQRAALEAALSFSSASSKRLMSLMSGRDNVSTKEMDTLKELEFSLKGSMNFNSFEAQIGNIKRVDEQIARMVRTYQDFLKERSTTPASATRSRNLAPATLPRNQGNRGAYKGSSYVPPKVRFMPR